MKTSRFLLSVQLNQNSFLVENLLTTAIVELDENKLHGLMQENYDFFSSDEIEGLKADGFLISGNEDDMFLDIYQQTWSQDETGRFAVFYLFLTANCQLRCDYCYEDGIDRSQSLNLETEKKIVDWIDRYIQNLTGKIDLLRIVFHGGEPLLRKGAIRSLLAAVAQICLRQKIKLETQIVTNGVALDEETVDLLSRHNLTRLQVTLDGPRMIHDQRRFFANGQGTYDIIMKNILSAVANRNIETVHIRINVDRLNFQFAPQLLRELGRNDILRDKIKLSLGLVTATLPNENCAQGAFSYVAVHGLQGKEAAEIYLMLAKEAMACGFEISLPYTIGPWCAARHRYAWMIGPDGSIYKCLSDFGRRESIVGNIDNGINGDLEITKRSDRKIRQCLSKNCNLVPVCGGGCLFERRIDTDELCPKELLQTINEGLLILCADKLLGDR